MIIDTHAHFYPEPYLDLVEAQGEKYPVSIVRDKKGQRVLRFGQGHFFTFLPRFYDIGVRLAEMEEAGVDMQVLSIAPPMVFWADPGLGRELCQIYNAELARLVRDYPGKFEALAAVPLQDVPSAVDVLRSAVNDLGMKGCLLGTNISFEDLDAEQFEDFFAAMTDLDVPAFMHPIAPAGRERMQRHRLEVIVGFTMDTTLAAARLVYGGHMERYPNLRILLSHFGGTVPFLRGRLSEGYESFLEETELALDKRFGGDAKDHFRKFYYDTLTYDSEVLGDATRWAGVDHVCFGTDNPFFGRRAMEGAIKVVNDCTALSEADRRAIFAENPARLFDIDLPGP